MENYNEPSTKRSVPPDMNPKTPRPRNWFKRFAVALAVTGVIGQVLAALAFV